ILPGRHLPDQRTDPADDLDDSITQSRYATECLADLLDASVLTIQKAQRGLGIGHGRRYRLVDLVCNRGQHLSERGDAVCMHQRHLYLAIPPLTLACLRFRTLAVRQVNDKSHAFLPRWCEARGPDQH